MKSFSRSMALAGLLISVSAHAQPAVSAYIEGASFSGASTPQPTTESVASRPV
jgi:hypothetical protein